MYICLERVYIAHSLSQYSLFAVESFIPIFCLNNLLMMLLITDTKPRPTPLSLDLCLYPRATISKPMPLFLGQSTNLVETHSYSHYFLLTNTNHRL